MYDVIVIGAGPAGLAAGLYAGRYKLNTLIMERMTAGGQIMTSPTIENFPGFPGSVATDELIARMKKQVDDVGVVVENRAVNSIAVLSGTVQPHFRLETDGQTYEARSLIIATGAHWKQLGLANESQLTGRGVSYCATCDGPFFKNKEICVVGGGDRAIEEAIYLTKYATKVTVVHRRQQFRATEVLLEQAKANPRISFLLDSTVEAINGQLRIESLTVKNVKTGALTQLPAQGLFVFIGINPNTEFLNGLLETDPNGFIIADQGMKTSQPGIFACGDCTKKILYQVVTACADGATAAHAVHGYLLTTT